MEGAGRATSGAPRMLGLRGGRGWLPCLPGSCAAGNQRRPACGLRRRFGCTRAVSARRLARETLTEEGLPLDVR